MLNGKCMSLAGVACGEDGWVMIQARMASASSRLISV